MNGKSKIVNLFIHQYLIILVISIQVVDFLNRNKFDSP